MTKTTISILTAALLCLGSQAATAISCKYDKRLDRELELDGASRLVITALAGELTIEGSDSSSAATVKAKACADNEEFLQRMDMVARRDFKNGVIKAVIPSGGREDTDYAYIDMELTVPAGVELVIHDSSGDMHLTHVMVIEIQDSSGDITLVDGSGDLSIEDSSGEIRIENLHGNLRVNDSSGEVRVSHAEGDILIENDSSGDLRIEDITGDVKIVNDSSGEIDIEKVSGHVLIGNDSSGSIQVRHVGGNVTVDSDGSGDIDVSDVEGDFAVHHKGDGDIHSKRIEGSSEVPHGR